MEMTSPEAVGLSSQRLQRIDTLMQAHVDQQKLAGVMTVVARRGRIAHWQCFGKMDIEANAPMQPDTILRMYSMSKPITSVAALMLEYMSSKDRTTMAFFKELTTLVSASDPCAISVRLRADFNVLSH